MKRYDDDISYDCDAGDDNMYIDGWMDNNEKYANDSIK